jgi:hypothetical protein
MGNCGGWIESFQMTLDEKVIDHDSGATTVSMG